MFGCVLLLCNSDDDFILNHRILLGILLSVSPFSRRKMTELRLLPGDKTETVVILMPDVWNLAPTAEDWAKLQEDRGVRTVTCCNHILEQPAK